MSARRRLTGRESPEEVQRIMAEQIAATTEAVHAYTMRVRAQAPPERPVHYVVSFDAVPSAWERIAERMREYGATNRSMRMYPAGAGREGGPRGGQELDQA